MKTFVKLILLCVIATITLPQTYAQRKGTTDQPLRLGVVGLVHGHVGWILGLKDDNIKLVGIAEPNRALAERLCKQYGVSMDIVYSTTEEMLAAAKPEAVSAFSSTFDHLQIVEACAPKGIHVMVEKPLAVNELHASKMLALAKKHDIRLLTNYETSWYGSNAKAYELINEEEKIGDIRKIIFHTGHQGPIEIGCSTEFTDWLTDPKLNGGGALMDFGCYGANIATWLMKGEKPLTVSAVTQQIKPDMYPKVEDEATIILTYPTTQVIIEASWNWPYGVKSMQVYGKTGYVICKNGTDMKILENEKAGEYAKQAAPMPANMNGPFTMLYSVVKRGVKLPKYDLTSEENNEIVVQILSAARHSAKTGKTIVWNEYYK